MNTRKIASQVAVEAIANDPAAYDQSTVDAVLYVAVEAGVSDFYLTMLPGVTHEVLEGILNDLGLAYSVSEFEGETCSQCGSILDTTEVVGPLPGDWSMCAPCVHDALRSGWIPGSE